MRRLRGTVPPPCAWCGKQFDRDDLRIKACSDECRRNCLTRSVRKHHGTDLERLCIECGTRMNTTDFRVQQCSEECRLRRQRRQKQYKTLASRAKRYGLMGQPFTEDELQAWVDAKGRACAYCGGPYEEIDHVVPFTRGGLHELANLNPSCAACNRSKAQSLLSEWPGRALSPTCSTEGCDDPMFSRGWCRKHYNQQYHRRRKESHG
jgi:hypothetical protein